MDDKAKAMVVASFLGDSLALGAHWMYDVDKIELRLGRVEHLLKPLKESYHPTKDAGDFTHYGDQTLVLLESVASGSGFDLEDFARSWKGLFQDYKGYMDHATKDTLKHFAQGMGAGEAGSHSSDFSGAARIAPLVYYYRDDLEGLLSSARAQTALTHNTPPVIQSSEFLARVTWAVLRGKRPHEAIREVLDASYRGTPLAESITEGLGSASLNTRDAILDFGQSCDLRGALPSVVHLMVRYEDNLKEALVENVMAGGDSAARGLAVGMVLGAHCGWESLPEEWVTSLKAMGHIDECLRKIDSAR